LAPNFTVSAAKAITLADFKPGAYVGSTPREKMPPVRWSRAKFTSSAQAAAGHTPWDTAPGDTMTNANLAKVVKTANGTSLTLEYRADRRRSSCRWHAHRRFRSGDKSLLVPGATVFTGAQVRRRRQIRGPVASR